MSGVTLPAFELEGGIVLALARGLSVAALLSVFGALLFRAAVAPSVLARMETGVSEFNRRWRFLFYWSWSAAIEATLAWLALQAASMASARSVLETASAIPTVLASTSFGHLLVLRLLVLLVTVLVLGRGARLRPWGATGLAALATGLQSGHSHAAAMYDGPSFLLLSQVVHLLAAGAWLGGLLPLLLLVAAAPPEAAALASRRFSPIATVCVLLLAMTASFQFWVLIGGLPGLVGTGYGVVALAKAGLFVALLGLASSNRFRLTPALLGPSAALSKRRLCRSIATETGVGLLVVMAAGVLTNLPPAVHVQPLWPFAERLSLAAVREDADLRLEIIEASLALAGDAALLLIAFLARRLRWPLVAIAVVIAWFAVPHLGLLLVEAYPTSFYRSPTGFAATTIAEGARLFPEHCAACHGTEGRADGPAAKKAPTSATDLTSGHLWMHSDGELFWWLSHGIDAPEGGQVMPGFAAVLTEDQRWDLIDYIRARNAGITKSSTGSWSPPVQAPELQATCGARTVTLGDLRGRFVRLVFGGPMSGETGGDVVTILAGTGGTSLGEGACAADDGSVPQAYAVVSGIPEHELPGTQFLIDGRGWLRAVQRPGDPESWNDPQALATELRDLKAHPIAASTRGGEPMNMRM
jgi:putative copper export protein/mono/diheme cytochrome c family protein